ncbi:MAG TPA: hypothetical protein VH518_07810 [Tepidisphaeraceae bacterium]
MPTPPARPLATAGYSGTPLAKKLGIKPRSRVFVENEPAHFRKLLEPLPPDVTFLRQPKGQVNLIHLFTRSAAELAKKLPAFLKQIPDDGVIWISWPKKAAKISTDMTEDVVRRVALPLGLVDVKVCAVDEIWSGLKLVIRVENRNGR